MSLAHIAQAADHQRLGWLGGSTMSILLDGTATQGQLTVVRSRLAPGAASPLHLHREEDEMFVVLSGRGLFYVGDEVHEVGDGGAVFLPRDVPHAYRILEDVDLLTLCTPSGIEGFFRGAGHDLDGLPPGSSWEIGMADLAAAAAAGGQEILGPPPPLPTRAAG